MPVLLPEERVGTTIAGKYRLDSILGRGGMGVVFAGHHEWTSRDVAVKLLNPELAEHRDAVHRFMQEARAAARLNSPHVVDVLDMGREEDGTVYMVLERLTGEPLEDRIERTGPLTVEQTYAALAPVMEALIEAHAAGIVHRDLKPDNIFLATGPKGEVVPKLLDFGVAKVAEASKNTKTGTMLGTPHYMSPEQVRGVSTVGAPADVWSMGVLLFECLSGALPFPGETTTGVLMSILMDDPARLAEASPSVPDGVVELVHSTLQREVGDRPASMAALLQSLTKLVGPLSDADLLRPAPVDPMASTGVENRATPISEVAERPPSRSRATPPPEMAEAPEPRPNSLDGTPAPFELVASDAESQASMPSSEPAVAVGMIGTPSSAELAKSGPALANATAQGRPSHPTDAGVPQPPMSRAPLVVALGLGALALGSVSAWVALTAGDDDTGPDAAPVTTVEPEPSTPDPDPEVDEPTAAVQPVDAPDVPTVAASADVEPEVEPTVAASADDEPEPEAEPRRRRSSSRRRAESEHSSRRRGATSPAETETAPALGANNAPILDL